jgi:hypothetical protein
MRMLSSQVQKNNKRLNVRQIGTIKRWKLTKKSTVGGPCVSSNGVFFDLLIICLLARSRFPHHQTQTNTRNRERICREISER